jgi:hypothetical protein
VTYFCLCAILLCFAFQSVGFAGPKKPTAGAGPKMDATFMKFLKKAEKEKPAGGNPVEVYVTPQKGAQAAEERYIGNLREQGYFIQYDTTKSGDLEVNGDPTPVLKLVKCAAVKFIAEKAGF